MLEQQPLQSRREAMVPPPLPAEEAGGFELEGMSVGPQDSEEGPVSSVEESDHAETIPVDGPPTEWVRHPYPQPLGEERTEITELDPGDEVPMPTIPPNPKLPTDLN